MLGIEGILVLYGIFHDSLREELTYSYSIVCPVITTEQPFKISEPMCRLLILVIAKLTTLQLNVGTCNITATRVVVQ